MMQSLGNLNESSIMVYVLVMLFIVGITSPTFVGFIKKVGILRDTNGNAHTDDMYDVID